MTSFLVIRSGPSGLSLVGGASTSSTRNLVNCQIFSFKTLAAAAYNVIMPCRWRKILVKLCQKSALSLHTNRTSSDSPGSVSSAFSGIS